MNKIIEEAREHYYQCKEAQYRAGEIWAKHSHNIRNLERFIKGCNTPESLLEKIGQTDMYAITVRGRERFDLMMEWNKKHLIVDAELATTPNLYKMAAYCERIIEHLSRNQPVIVELGGGNGQFAYMAKNTLSMQTHIDIDLPESLYMAYVCTRHRFPDANCLWADQDTRQADFQGYDFIFVPVGLEQILSGMEVDLFINTASLGEMSNQNIRYWVNFIEEAIDLKAFYVFNRFLNTIPADPEAGWHQTRKNENEASVLFGTNWHIEHWEVEPIFARCPIDDPRIARYLEICASRVDDYDTSAEDISDIEHHDWWCYRDIDPVGTYRDNQLVNNMKNGGTLYRLWDAIRHGNKKAVEMMLVYLKTLRRDDIIFEEELYYRRIL